MNNKVVIGVYNNIDKKSNSYQEHIRDITYFSIICQLHLNQDTLRQKVIEDTNIDTIISKASLTGCKWLFLISYGSRFYNHNIIQKVISQAENSNSPLIGHPLQIVYENNMLGEKEYFIHPQNFFLNLETWIKIGKPSFGSPGIQDIDLHIAERSKQNFHDNYTPFWLKPTGKIVHFSGYLETGWNLINELLNNNYSIEAFNTDIKKDKMYIYPEKEKPGLEDILVSSSNREVTDDEYMLIDEKSSWYLSETELKGHQNFIYIFNTDRIKKETLLEKIKEETLQNIYCTASGFKSCILLHQINWNSKTRVIHYDYSVNSLNFRKWLIENWDGIDYYATILKYKKEVSCEVEYLWHSQINLNVDKKEITKEFEVLKDFYGGEKEWLNFWNDYKNLSHIYIQCDLMKDFNPIVNDMKKNLGNNLIWLSNIFFSEPIIRNYSPTNLKATYKNLVSSMQSHSNKLEVVGSQPINPHLYDLYTE